MVLAASHLWSCLHLFLTLLGCSFLLLSISDLIACPPPAPPKECCAAQGVSGATSESKWDSSPSMVGAEMLFHHHNPHPLVRFPIPNGLFSDALRLGSLHEAPQKHICLPGETFWQASLQKFKLSSRNPLSLWQTRAEGFSSAI